MGLKDRLHKVLTGLGGAIQAPFGLVKDLATAPWRDEDEFDGFFNTIYRRGIERGAQAMGNLVGPQEGIGEIIGAVPQAVREPARNVIEPVGRAVETVYREAISEPITAYTLASELSEREGRNWDIGAVPEYLRRGYRLAQPRDTSPGQALAIAVGDVHPEDVEAVNRYASTDSYEIISGVTDALLRFTSDPTVLVGGGLGAVRHGIVARPIRTAEDINRALGSRRGTAFVDGLVDKSAAEIRHEFFPDHAHGAPISVILAEAGDTPTRVRVLRALMGDANELEVIQSQRVDVAGKIARLIEERDINRHLQADGTLFDDPAKRQAIEAELEALYPEADRLTRMNSVVGQLRVYPRRSYLAAAARP